MNVRIINADFLEVTSVNRVVQQIWTAHKFVLIQKKEN